VGRAVFAEAVVVVWFWMAAPADVALVGGVLWQDWVIWRLERHAWAFKHDGNRTGRLLRQGVHESS